MAAHKKKKKPANNPALAGKHTQAFAKYQASKKKDTPTVDDPNDTPAQERMQRRQGFKT